MNISRISLLFSLLLLVALFGCRDHSTPATPDTCKLAAIDRGNLNKHIYAYDANGRISQMTREFDGDGSGKVSRFVYSFTFDGAGLLTKSTITLDSKPYGTETYAYTNGRVSKATFNNTDGSNGVNNIKYNAAGQMTEFTIETGDPNYDGKQYFEYNTDGVMTRRGFADLGGVKFFEIVFKPVGIVKAPEQLLAKYGIPYDVLTGIPWSIASGGVGSAYEVFAADPVTGKLVSTGDTGKVTALKTNTKGYLTEITDVDNTNVSSTQRFTITDCN